MRTYINRKLVPFVLVGMLCFIGGFFAEKTFKKYKLQKMGTNDEVVMSALESMIVLPNELPSIATVTDKEKLVDQPYFQKAENGDKVIIYPQSKRAYLFRPREQKIIDMTVIATENINQGAIPTFETNGQ